MKVRLLLLTSRQSWRPPLRDHQQIARWQHHKLERRGERLFGFVAEEMVEQPIARIIPPEWIEDENRILARLRSGERIENYETQRLAKDGRRIDVSLTISPIRDAAGKIIGASKIARDITDRKQAEEALRQSEERLKRALAAARAGFGKAGSIRVNSSRRIRLWPSMAYRPEQK